MHSFQSPRGMTLIDVVVGTALVVIVFSGIFAALNASISLSSYVKNEAAADSIANNEMEYIRSLSYDQVGTIGGIPSGVVPQTSTTTQDSTMFTVHTFIDYYDDSADGTGVNDTNTITTDYKRVDITVTYTTKSGTKTAELASIFAPPGIETTTGGGTLQVLVVTSTGSPLVGAVVHIVNSAVSPAVDLTAFSDRYGSVTLPGALASSQYQVTVSNYSGYSVAQTYARNSNNQNPTPGYMTVAANQTTTGTFAIDALANLTIGTFSPIATSTFSDAFVDTTKLASHTNTAIRAGGLALTNGSSGYVLSGTAIASTTAPAYLASWGALNATLVTPSGTDASVQVLDQSGNPIPEVVLPGNAAGFRTFPVSLAGVSTTTYPALELSVNLSTTNPAVTPMISAWSLSSRVGPIPIPNVTFGLVGAKTIGSTGTGAPIYKTTVTATTSSTGTDTLPLEWDSYSLTVPSYDVVDACGAPPFALAPATNVSESLILGASTANSMLVTVTDSLGNIVPGASVTVSRSGYSSIVQTSACGTAYFGNISSANDYSVTIAKTGYTSLTTTGVVVSGQEFYDEAF